MVRTVSIFVFDEIEVLDLAGPFEVFSVASRLALRRGEEAPFRVVTVSRDGGEVAGRGGFRFRPSHGFADAPGADLLIVPGGVVEAECARPEVIGWIRAAHARAELTASVCTGAFLLAQAGLLGGLPVTTHHEDIDALARRFPELSVARGRAWVDTGRIVTSAGISAGIDMCLHLLARLEGQDAARAVARQMEYPWRAEDSGA